jgi:hypothetical protein
MNRPDPIDVLNHLLRLLFRSLPVYLSPFPQHVWARDGEAPGLTVLQTIAADRKRLAKRLADAIEQRGGLPDAGRFPAAFTAMNDLSLEYILDRAGRAQQEEIPALRRHLAELEGDPEAYALAAEILANACKHQQMLDGLKSVSAAPPSPSGRGLG